MQVLTGDCEPAVLGERVVIVVGDGSAEYPSDDFL